MSDALSSYNSNRKKDEMLKLQVEDLEKAVNYTQLLFTTGDATYLEVLSAQQGLLSSQISDINCWHSSVAAIISLYQSLGGGTY